MKVEPFHAEDVDNRAVCIIPLLERDTGHQSWNYPSTLAGWVLKVANRLNREVSRLAETCL
jgi:hypothetical protein